MSLSEILQQQQLITNCILTQLDAKSLAYFGSCNRSCRSIVNTTLLWKRICASKKYERFAYLNTLSNHPLLPTKTSVITPIYFQYDTETLQKLNEWHEIFLRVKHLEFNWQNGIYFVLPLLKAHKYKISSIDSNGSIIVSGSKEEKLIKIWSIEECDCINTIKLRTDFVNCIKIYNGTIIAAGDDGIIRIYDQSEGDLLQTLVTNNTNSSISKVLIAQNKLISIFNDRVIRIWSLETYEFLFILRGHEDEIESVNAHDHILITGSWDNSCIIWDLKHGLKLAKLCGHTEVINDLTMKQDTIVTASSDSTLRIWKIKMSEIGESKKPPTLELKEEPLVLRGHSSDIYCVKVNGDYICSGGADSSIIVWSFDGKLLHKLNGHLGIVRNLFMDDYKLVSGGDAKKIMIWDYKRGILLNEVHRNPNKLNSMIVTDTNIITESLECRNDFFSITVITYW